MRAPFHLGHLWLQLTDALRLSLAWRHSVTFMIRDCWWFSKKKKKTKKKGVSEFDRVILEFAFVLWW